MGETRTQKSLRNAKWGILLQFVTMMNSLLVRTLFIRNLGISLNGLNGLMTEVVAILSMAEMGVGTAITFHLYKPLAAGDTTAVNGLMALYCKAYRVIAGALVVIGLCIMPFIQKIVTGVDFSVEYIRLVFGLFILQTASTYLFSYKRALFNADQKNYVVTLFSISFSVLTAIASALALVLTRNYIVFLAVQIVMSLLSNIAFSAYADQKYPFLREKAVTLSQEERKSVFSSLRHLFIGLISGKITTSTDNILISVLVSTYQIGIYGNYAMINNAVLGLFRKVSSGMSGSMGNLYVSESHERTEMAFRRMEFAFKTAGLAISLMMFAAITPFVRLWLGEDFLLSEAVLFVCMLNQFLFIAREPLWLMGAASGLFSIDKYVSILGSVINLVVSIVLGKLWGMIGIFIGTSCTLVIQIVLKEWFLYRCRLQMIPWKALGAWGVHMALFLLGALGLHYLCPLVQVRSRIVTLFFDLLLSGALSVGMILLFYGRTKEFSYLKSIILKKKTAQEP